MGKKKRNKSAQASGSGAVATEIRQVATPRTQGFSVAQTSKPNFFTGPVFEWLAIAATSLLAFWFLTARIVGVQVSVLADEYLYLLDAHYKGLDEATYPNYLFQWIYSSTKMCGAEFYSCARSINTFFVIFGAIFIYLLAKYIGRSKWLGALAAIAAILGSYGTYTAYFMPEAIFNGLMMVFFWALIRFGKSDNLLVWAAIGASLGIASLAKPHGLFVIPAIVIFVVLWTRATKDKWLVAAALRSVVFIGSVVGSKFLFGYLLAGERALNLFGMYGNLETVSRDAASTIAAEVASGTSVISTAWGQTLMIAMVLGLALPVAVHGLIIGFRRDPEQFEAVKTRAVIAISLLNMMAVSAVFEAWQNLGVWMHTRYYSYLIPLAVVALVEAFRRSNNEPWRWAKYLTAGIFLALGAVNLFTNAAPFSSNWIDAPDFNMHIQNLQLSTFAVGIFALAVLVWIWRPKVAVGVALSMTFILSAFTGGHINGFLKTAFGSEMGYEHIARVVSSFLPQDEADRVVFYGQNEVLQRIVFSSLTGTAQIIPLNDAGIDRSDIESSKSWLIALGDPALRGFGEPTISGGGYDMYSLDESNALAPRVAKEFSGSSPCPESEAPEWSCGTETSVSLGGSFPIGANVDVVLEVSDQAALGEFEFTLGDATVTGPLAPGLNSLNINFQNTKPEKFLVIRHLGAKSESEISPQKFVRVVWMDAN
jgi:phosphoglycerol transferase